MGLYLPLFFAVKAQLGWHFFFPLTLFYISSRFNIQEELLDFTAHCEAGHETKIYVGMVATVALIILITLLVIAGTYLETEQAKAEAREKFISQQPINGSAEVNPLLLEASDEMEAPRRNADDLNAPNPVRTGFVLPLSHRTTRSKLGKLKEVLKCFGLRTNTKFLFADNRASEPHLACLNGLRTLMMAWVVLGHTFTYMAAPIGYDNLMTIKQLVSRFSFQVIPAAGRYSLSGGRALLAIKIIVLSYCYFKKLQL